LSFFISARCGVLLSCVCAESNCGTAQSSNSIIIFLIVKIILW